MNHEQLKRFIKKHIHDPPNQLAMLLLYEQFDEVHQRIDQLHTRVDALVVRVTVLEKAGEIKK